MSRLSTILIADAEPDLNEVIVAILTEAGYSVLTAVNGREAVRLLADNRVDLLITDVAMSGIDGFELARQAKVMHPHLNVIYLSGYPPEGEEYTRRVFGAIFQKPVRMRDLLDEVAQHLA
jgi:CheY-like chemotaxis protein